MHPFNVEVSPIFERAFAAIDKKHPLAIDALEALVQLLQVDPFQSGSEIPGRTDFFVAVTPRTLLRPSLRIIYEVERSPGRVMLWEVELRP